ncbi:MAG TPA: outer membrane beta-barrel protein [Vicinamibacterales bacterium]|jgi:hypothetical protein
MNSNLHRLGLLVAPIVLVVLGSAPASAQSVPSGADWTHGTTLSLFGGASTDSNTTGPYLGGGIGWEIKPTFAIEGTMGWIDRPGADTSAYNAGLMAQFSLPGSTKASPFVAGGFGLYRASFGVGSEMPEFYSRRISATDPAQPRTFTDPAFIFGGGVNIYLSRHLAVRPNVDVMMVFDNSYDYWVTGFAVHFAYHFEDHPVTPWRR